MRFLEMIELRAVLAELLAKRLAALRSVTHGAKHEATVRRILGDIDALPEALRKLPLVDLLAALDAVHDAWAVALDHVVGAIEEGPEVLAPLHEAVALARARYITGRGEVRAPYAVEAQRGADRLATLEADAAVLDAVTAPDGRKLSAWIHDFATAGVALSGALTRRTESLGAAAAATDVGTVQALRAEALATFAKIRTQIALDLDGKPELPRTLESDVLGYLDELSRLAGNRARPSKKKAAGTTTTATS